MAPDPRSHSSIVLMGINVYKSKYPSIIEYPTLPKLPAHGCSENENHGLDPFLSVKFMHHDICHFNRWQHGMISDHLVFVWSMIYGFRTLQAFFFSDVV